MLRKRIHFWLFLLSTLFVALNNAQQAIFAVTAESTGSDNSIVKQIPEGETESQNQTDSKPAELDMNSSENLPLPEKGDEILDSVLNKSTKKEQVKNRGMLITLTIFEL